MTEGWVIMNANMDQYRAWQNGGTVWVKDLADATFYARRVDAEAVHLDDDAAWRVVRKPLPDGGEAVHARPLSAASADPKNSLSPPTVEVGGVPEGWVLVPREPPTELLVSMAVRQDHGLGVPGYYDQPIFGAENLGHHRRMESALSDMRKLYEEVVGDGFYAPEHAERYRELIPAAPSREADDAPR